MQVFVSSIVIGELYYGSQKSARVQENIRRIDEFVVENVILGCDAETGKRYGEIKDKLRKKGRPIPENDIWIAAVSIQYKLTLISRDNHFEAVDGLGLDRW